MSGNPSADRERLAVGDAIIRPATEADADALARIYNHYIEHTIVTFEEQPVTPQEMAARCAEVQAASLPWPVAEEEGRVVGYAYATSWKGRCAYRFTKELTVYLEPGRGGRGLGSALYRRVIAELQDLGMHAAIGGVALPNPASVALHEKLGFEKVAHFPQVGFKLGRWIDVGYWQRLL